MARYATGGDYLDPAPRDHYAVSSIHPAADARGAPIDADRTRTEMLHAIDGQLTELNQLIGAHHDAGVETVRLALLTEAANTLAVLRGQIETARSPVQLAALRQTMTGAVQGAGAAMTATVSGISAQQQLAARLYDTRMTAVEHGMADISRRDDALFASADSRAEQLGLDIGFFRGQRSLFEAEAEEARKRGDRFGAIVPEGLLAHNTANMWEDIADRTGLPEDRKKAAAAHRNAEEADRKVREAAQAEAERAAAGREFANEADRDRWIAHNAADRFDGYQERVNALHRPARGPDHRDKMADLAAERSHELGVLAKPEQSDAAKAFSALPAAARNAAKEAGRAVAQDTSQASADDEPKIPAASPLNVAAARGAPGSSVTL